MVGHSRSVDERVGGVVIGGVFCWVVEGVAWVRFRPRGGAVGGVGLACVLGAGRRGRGCDVVGWGKRGRGWVRRGRGCWLGWGWRW